MHEGQLMARIIGAVARKESDDKSRRIQPKHEEIAPASPRSSVKREAISEAEARLQEALPLPKVMGDRLGTLARLATLRPSCSRPKSGACAQGASTGSTTSLAERQTSGEHSSLRHRKHRRDELEPDTGRAAGASPVSSQVADAPEGASLLRAASSSSQKGPRRWRSFSSEGRRSRLAPEGY